MKIGDIIEKNGQFLKLVAYESGYFTSEIVEDKKIVKNSEVQKRVKKIPE